MKIFRINILITMLFGLMVAAPVSAITLSLTPANAVVTSGQIVALDLVVDGLGFQQAPSLGDFEIDLTFDPNALDFVGYTLGAALGDLSTFQSIDVSFGLYLPGTINLAQVSLLAAAALDAAQPDTFVLATLQFMVTGLAASAVTSVDIASVAAFGDATAAPLSVDAVSGSQLTGAVVPLPAGFWLLGTALLMLSRSVIRTDRRPQQP